MHEVQVLWHLLMVSGLIFALTPFSDLHHLCTLTTDLQTSYRDATLARSSRVRCPPGVEILSELRIFNLALRPCEEYPCYKIRYEQTLNKTLCGILHFGIQFS